MTTLCWGQTMKNMNDREKFQYIFENLNKDTLQLIDEFYDPQVEFHDPVGTIKGSVAIKNYYESLYKNVTSIRFNFTQFIQSEDYIVGVWTMILVTDKLNGGNPVVVDGNSVIKFKNGKAIYHRDYFDMGAFIYENVPVLGFIIKKIRERMKVVE